MSTAAFDAMENAVRAERDRIVAYIRKEAGGWAAEYPEDRAASALRSIARAIDAETHLDQPWP